MTSNVRYVRYYFPNGLRWTFSIMLLPLAIYLMIINWFIAAFFCVLIVFSLWTFKYVTSIDLSGKIIRDIHYRFAVPIGKTYRFSDMENLFVTREQKSYKAASRSRDYWVNYTEYSLSLKYDQNKQLTLFTFNDPDTFKEQVQKFAKKLNLRVETS